MDSALASNFSQATMSTPNLCFDVCAWYEDLYGFHEETMTECDAYETLGYVINEDNSVYLRYDNHTVDPEVAKRYLHYEVEYSDDPWGHAETTELMDNFDEFVTKMSMLHNRTPESIASRIKELVDF